jgi:sec-independent protein translocase protein TatA
MDAFAPWHIILLVIVLVVLFGAKKLPMAARSLGESMRIFKAETKGLHDDDQPADAAKVTPAAALPVTPQPPPSHAPAPDAAQQQIQDLQRQLQDLQRQSASGEGVAANRGSFSETQPNQQAF